MKAHALRPSEIGEAQLGWAVTESLRTTGGERLLPKGGLINRETVGRMSDLEDVELHLIEPGPNDIHENEAGRRLCKAAVGPGIEIDGPHHSRFNLNAKHRGLLRVDGDMVQRINRVGEVTLFTLFDRQAVLAGKTVAGAKSTPIVVPEARVIEIERLIGEYGQPVVDVLPFQKRQAFVVATEALHERLRDRFREMVTKKLAWYGTDVIDVDFTDPDPDAVAASFRDGLNRGANVLLAAGGNTLDPLDPIFLALPRFGAKMVHFGAPADPGSMFWTANVDGKPIFNLASCAMYSQATVIDLMLPLAMAGIDIEAEHITELGYGGLLEDEMLFRFPPYDLDAES